MTKAELNEIMFALDDVEARERRFCDEYIKFNPDDKYRRQYDRDLYLTAIQQARYEIKKHLHID